MERANTIVSVWPHNRNTTLVLLSMANKVMSISETTVFVPFLSKPQKTTQENNKKYLFDQSIFSSAAIPSHLLLPIRYHSTNLS